MMKKIHFLLLISLLLAACSDDDKEKQPAFVTNITCLLYTSDAADE